MTGGSVLDGKKKLIQSSGNFKVHLVLEAFCFAF